MTPSPPSATPDRARRASPWLVAVLGAAAGVAGTVAWLGRAGPAAPAAPVDAAVPRTAVAQPRRSAAPDVAPDARPSSGPLAPPEQRQRTADQFARYESSFRQDTVDPRWAAAAERTLVEAASDPGLVAYGVPTQFDARCMAHLCKVAMSFDSVGQAKDWAELYVLGMAGAVNTVQILQTTGPDGRPQLVLYGARSGSERLLSPPPAPTRSSDGT